MEDEGDKEVGEGKRWGRVGKFEKLRRRKIRRNQRDGEDTQKS